MRAARKWSKGKKLFTPILQHVKNTRNPSHNIRFRFTISLPGQNCEIVPLRMYEYDVTSQIY